MVQRDYILRLIEQMGAVLAELRRAILGRMRGDAGSEGAAASQTEDVLRRAAGEAGMDLALARAASADALPAMLSPGGEVDPMRCWLLAEVLMTDGVQRWHEGSTEAARSSLAKAAVLFKLTGPGFHLAGFPEARDRLEEIESLLARLPAEPPASDRPADPAPPP